MQPDRSQLSDNDLVAPYNHEFFIDTNPTNPKVVQAITCIELDADISGNDHLASRSLRRGIYIYTGSELIALGWKHDELLSASNEFK
jgi:hypothetical protein